MQAYSKIRPSRGQYPSESAINEPKVGLHGGARYRGIEPPRTETLAEALWSRTTHWNQQFKRHLDQRKVPDPFDADSFGGKAGLVGQPWPHLTILVYDKP